MIYFESEPSPFFQNPDQAMQCSWFCGIHRAAPLAWYVRLLPPMGNWLMNLKSGLERYHSFQTIAIPSKYVEGLPMTNDGAIVSSVGVTPTAGGEWELFINAVEMKRSKRMILRNVLDSDSAVLKSRDLLRKLKANVDFHEESKLVLRSTLLIRI